MKEIERKDFVENIFYKLPFLGRIYVYQQTKNFHSVIFCPILRIIFNYQNQTKQKEH